MDDDAVKIPELEESKEAALHYMKTMVEVARESFLILDVDLKVITANPTFYQNFRVTPEQTQGQFVYNLGNGQWNLPELKKLLEEILPEKKTVKDYEVEHNFETIGKKTILLNGRQIDSVNLIVLAMEDITLRKNLENKVAQTVKDLAVKVEERTLELRNRVNELESLNKSMVGRELKMVELKKEIADLRTRGKNENGQNGRLKNGNGNHKNS